MGESLVFFRFSPHADMYCAEQRPPRLTGLWIRSFGYRRVHVHPASSFILIPNPMSSVVTANLISLSVGLFLFEGCILCVPNVRFRLSVMTSCIAFFLCLIDVLSYDLVQVISSGCYIPFLSMDHKILDV